MTLEKFSLGVFNSLCFGSIDGFLFISKFPLIWEKGRVKNVSIAKQEITCKTKCTYFDVI